MKTNIKLIISAALLAVLVAPASARFDSDEGFLSGYPRFRYERNLGSNVGTSDLLINRPFHQR